MNSDSVCVWHGRLHHFNTITAHVIAVCDVLNDTRNDCTFLINSQLCFLRGLPLPGLLHWSVAQPDLASEQFKHHLLLHKGLA